MIRDLLLKALVVWGMTLFAITEGLSLFDGLRRTALAICWILAAALSAWCWRRWVTGISAPALRGLRDPVVLVCCGGTAVILALTAITAIFSPPNTYDAMAYHMPRVVYWAEQASVRFFPTAYLNQIMMPPFAEYCMFHTYVLTGGDRWINLVQWFGSLGSIVGVAAVAREFGAGARGQALASLFCATIPGGVLAASGAKNDYWLAMWLVAAIYFAARFARTQAWADAVFLGCAVGLAMLTKGTSYLFAPWLLAAVLLPAAGNFRRREYSLLLAAAACALAINTPHYSRNIQLSGSPLGFDSAHGDGLFRWRNDTLGWKATISNALRNVSDQLGSRSDHWNQRVYQAVVDAHKSLGLDVNDPATTWRWATFQPPVNTNHESNANSQWHLLILLVASAIAVWRRRWREAAYAAALFCGFVAFCLYLKWHPYEARLLLPLLVAAAPLAGAVLDFRALPRIPRLLLQLGLCWYLLSIARRPVLENWLRPLRGPHSVFHVPRDDQYFADIADSNLHIAYQRIAEELASGTCRTIGIDAGKFPLEYPLMALLRERRPAIAFVHTGVTNPSARFRQPVDEPPCAVAGNIGADSQASLPRARVNLKVPYEQHPDYSARR